MLLPWTPGMRRRRDRRHRLEPRLMGTMTMDAQQILLRAVPLPDTASVHAGAPVPVLLAMTLAAQSVRFLERHELPAREMKSIAIVDVVTIEAPPVLCVMLQLD